METKVIFRKYKDGEIIALFPETIRFSSTYWIDCFTLVGEHSYADYYSTIRNTKLATENEYRNLYDILENRGYNLNVQKRIGINYKHKAIWKESTRKF